MIRRNLLTALLALLGFSQFGTAQLSEDLVLLLGGPFVVGPIVVPTDATGAFSLKLPFPNSPSTIGTSIFMQVGGSDASGFTGSNAVHIIVCK